MASDPDDATILRTEARRVGVPPHVKRVLLRAARLVAADDEEHKALKEEGEMRGDDTKQLGPVRR